MARPILYISGERLFPKWEQMSPELQEKMLDSWASTAKMTTLKLGGVEVGKCVETRVRAEEGTVGLVIEWREDLVVGSINDE